MPGSCLVGGCTITAVSPDVCAANDLLSRLAPTVEPLTTFRKLPVFYHVEPNGSLCYSARYRCVRHCNCMSMQKYVLTSDSPTALQFKHTSNLYPKSFSLCQCHYSHRCIIKQKCLWILVYLVTTLSVLHIMQD